MAIVLTDDNHYKDIAKSIRNNLPLDNHGELRPNEMADAIQQACDNKRDEGIGTGYHQGQEDGYTSGFADGKAQGVEQYQSDLWDIIQNYGKRTSYVYAFGSGFMVENFLPKHDFNVTNANGMFSGFGKFLKEEGILSPPINLREILEQRDITLNTKASTNFAGFATNSNITALPPIDLTGCASISTFVDTSSELHTIDLIINENNKFHASNGFVSCRKLANLTITGVLASSLNLQSPQALTKASIQNIFAALSENTTGLALTLNTAAVNKAFETSAGANNGTTSTEWVALTGTKTNWRINLG